MNLLEKTPARVIVFSGDRAYRWTSEPTSAASIPFPKEERAKLKPGVVYYWAFVDSEEPAKAFVLK
ncbi:MAG TPA: hypothetical protein VGR00_00055 [Thermoanaerobaculia bacterium]|nr:hypothetical protein [Thermoanaerobaculia bacterium]